MKCKQNTDRISTKWNEHCLIPSKSGRYMCITPKFVEKTCVPNLIGSLAYIKCFSSSSPKPVKSFSNFIRYNCQKSCS